MEEEKRRCKNVGGLTVSIVLSAGGLVGLIVCGVVIVQPVVETGSLSFLHANCTTSKSYFTGETPSCNCGKYCNSWYPCVRYLVQYVPAAGRNTTARGAVMFDTESALSKLRSAAENEQCATRPCNGDRGKKELDRFNTSYGVGQSYDCLYDPEDPEFVILTRLFTWDAMFHSMLWTSIGFVVFFALFVYFVLKLKTQTAPESTVTSQKDNPPPSPVFYRKKELSPIVMDVRL